jgi:hypothetical protein
MSIRKTLLAAAMAVVALAAMPAFASALPTADLPANLNFTVHGGAASITAGLEPNCTTTTGSGKFEDGSTGKIKLTFHACKASILNCSTGMNPGTIETTELPFHLVFITNGKPGILVTPGANNHFVSFSCVLGNAVMGGNGFIGEITSPCNVKSKTFGVRFAGTGTAQNHKTIDGSATEYSLTQAVGGGAPANAALDSSFTATFTEGESTLTC